MKYEDALKAYKEGAVFTAFDLETTGLDPCLDTIVEIGAVKFDNNGIIARFSALINPGIPMPKEAQRVNNISDEMLRGKPALEKVLPDFMNFINGTILIAHNAGFDCGFINEKLKNNNQTGDSLRVSSLSRLPNPVADTLVFSREVFPGLPGYSLQKLVFKLGIPRGNAHRAEDDAFLCMEVFIRCMKEGFK